MSTYTPVTLEGANLKERHRYLNALVRQAYENNVPIKDIIGLPEKSAIDRIFKIDLASKYKYTEYILENLKNDDMLFVSRSLKSLWLLDLEYQDIINPSYLENVLYPEMIQPAVNKMKHWLRLHLKNPKRCREFYYHYKNNIDDAIDFFRHSSQDFILNELPNVIDKLTVVHVKMLFEICPAACGSYFEILPKNRSAMKRYVQDEKYFTCIKYLYKYDGHLFLNLVEKYFNITSHQRFKPSLTKNIMKKYKSRILDKIELYASSVLHLPTLALHINSDEAKQVTLRLARAEFLSFWFSYQNVEPILKRVKTEDRTLLKKHVFVDKAVTNMVKDWPYPKPTPLDIKEEEKYDIGMDIGHNPYEYVFDDSKIDFRAFIKKRAYRRQLAPRHVKKKSPLDKLFNHYRFSSFEKTFYELTKGLLAEGSSEGRLNMMLVLVSKSGGISVHVEKLLRFLVQRHRNEPNTLRAAVIRSLVKRECVWRVQDRAWDLLLQFGWDLGLDGSKTELVCREGLHAVIIWHLLNDTTLAQKIVTGFLECFSTLAEYKLNVHEKEIISKRLPRILFTFSPVAFLDCIGEYKMDINDFPEAKPYLITAAKEEPNLLSRLFDAKIFRRELYREAFTLKQTDDVYVNALRHDIDLLDRGKIFTALCARKRPTHDKFLHLLCIYFSEPGGLAEQHRMILEDALIKDRNTWFARPFCTLTPTLLLLNILSESYIKEMPKDKERLKILAAIKSNVHKSKPAIDIDEADWRVVGVASIANKVLICRSKDRERYLKKVLQRKQTVKISLRLSYNTSSDFVDVFLHVSSIRSSVALKLGLKLLFAKDNIVASIWNVLKRLIENIKSVSNKRNLLRKLENWNLSPKSLAADYGIFLFDSYMKIDEKDAMPTLCFLENLLPEVDKNFITSVVKNYINDDLSPEKFRISRYSDKIRGLHFRIIAKHLTTSRSEEEQKYLLQNVCDKLFDAIEVLFQTEENQVHLKQSLDQFVSALKFTKSFLGDYVSCMPVFESILNRFYNILPIEENFDIYVQINLTIFYFKAIKQAIEIKSDIFENPNNCKHGIKNVGEIFGNFVGNEIKETVTKYFRSIVEIYKEIFHSYLRTHFAFSKSRNLLVAFIIKGILQANTVEALLLAEHIFRKEHQYIYTPHRKLLDVFKVYDNTEVKFFSHAHIFNAKNLNRL